MKMYTQTLQESNDDIALLAAQNIGHSKSNIFPFANSREFLAELFIQYDNANIKLVSIGAINPDLALAADKAKIQTKEFVHDNPFSYNIESAVSSIRSNDIIYIANPNKITGANLSLESLRTLAQQVNSGLLIIDEYYFDFFGVSAIALTKEFKNVIVLRSFTSAYGIYSSEAGYAVSSEQIIEKCNTHFTLRSISTILRKTILAAYINLDAFKNRIKEIRDESLRLTTELTKIGIQCRMTATDFLLMRVASPKDVGNFLTAKKIDIENLAGYPSMENYIRYRIESFYSNDKLIQACQNMPQELYKMKSQTTRKLTLRRPHGEQVEPDKQIEELLNSKIKERQTSIQPMNSKHLFQIAD